MNWTDGHDIDVSFVCLFSFVVRLFVPFVSCSVDCGTKVTFGLLHAGVRQTVLKCTVYDCKRKSARSGDEGPSAAPGGHGSPSADAWRNGAAMPP